MPTVIDVSKIQDMKLSAKADEARRAAADGADTLSAAANEFGREAIKLSRDAVKLGREAARRSLVLATSGEKALRRASTDAQATIEDLRSYEIVRKRRGPDWRPGLALIAGVSAGLAAMYLLDPEQGRRRRIELMEQAHKYARISSERLEATVRDLRNRSQGLAIEARKAMQQARGEADYAVEHGVMDTPDVSDRLAATDWPADSAAEPAAELEPASSEPYRS
jgi:hypothetical protein